MLLAVPLTVLMAASRVKQFKSGIFTLAMSSTCFRVTLPTKDLPVSPAPFFTLAAFIRRIDAGGVLRTKLKERSEYTVITQGVIIPTSFCVAALNFLQNSMMFTPCCPNAGPTGGAGFACPAGHNNFIC